MKKINKLDLSGVEHLSDHDAKEYVADSTSSECIQEADDLSKSGSEGESGSQQPGTGEIPTDDSCKEGKLNESCSYHGQVGVCTYLKFPKQPGSILNTQWEIRLVCAVDGHYESGVQLSEREWGCIGAKYGDPCSYMDDYGIIRTGFCFYNKDGKQDSILACRGADYKKNEND